MAPSILYDHWKKQQAVFLDNLAHLQEKPDTEAIHECRVAIKKLRAFLSCYGALQEDSQTDIYLRQTNALFDVMGRQRNIEVSLNRLLVYKKEKNISFPRLQQFLQTQLKAARALTNEEVHRYHKKELAQVTRLLKEEAIATATLMTNKLPALLRQRKEAIHSILRRPHQVRKQLKELAYWIGLLPAGAAARWQPDELQSVLHSLGNWQDGQVLRTLIRHFRKDYLPASMTEAAFIRQWEEQIQKDDARLLRQTRRKVQDWLINNP